MDLLSAKRKLLPMSGPQDSGGGGGGGGTQTTVSDLPEWAKPYAEKTLAKTEALTTDKPYQSYGQWATQKGYDPTQVAGFTGLQQRAFQGAEGMQTAPQMGPATGIAAQAAGQALGAGAGFNPYQPGMLTAQAPGLAQYQMGPAQQVRADMFGNRQAAQYMSPYIEQAMEPQLREAARASDIQRNINQAQAVQQGAFGGGRQAIVEAERQRNLATQQGDIRARGLQSAYEQAQAQFNQDAARRLQAQQLNQQAGLTVGGQNLQALLGTQQLGAQTGLQAQLANQQAYQQAQQLAEQSRQYGAGLGLQGLQTALQGAGQLGNLGGQQFQQAMDINKLQQAYGTQQQQLNQAQINALQQQYAAEQKYPYQQLEFMSNILRGTPMGTVQTLYGAQPTALQSLGSLGLGAYGLNQLMRAEGGTVSSYADGGSVEDPQNIEDIVSKLSDAQLDQAAKAAQARGDVAQFQIIQQEQAMRASERGGIAGAFNQLPQGQQQKLMAGGGIVAFAGDEDENEEGLGQLVGGLAPSAGNPKAYAELTSAFPALLANVAKAKYTPMKDEDYNKAIEARRKMLEEGAGPSPIPKAMERLEAMRGEGEQELAQGKGLAALQAAAALSQGRGLMQGLGRAGGAFAESYGRALQADSAQKRAMMNMEINLADAQRKERMGLNREAIAAADQARKDHDAAQQFGIRKAQALANVAGKFAQATKPTGGAGGAGKTPKINEQLAAAEIEHETNPTAASLARVTALRRAVGQTRDVGPTRAGLAETQSAIKLGEAINKAQSALQYTPEYLKADEATKKQMMKDAADRVRANAAKAGSVNVNSTDGGQTDYSSLWNQ